MITYTTFNCKMHSLYVTPFVLFKACNLEQIFKNKNNINIIKQNRTQPSTFARRIASIATLKRAKEQRNTENQLH